MINEFSVVHTREEFAVFLHSLLNDLLKNRQGWENTTLEHFLEAMAAWAEDGSQYYAGRSLPEPPVEGNWQAIVDIMMAARVYE